MRRLGDARDRGSAVVGATLNMALLLLLAVSLAGISLLGYQMLVLRDIAVSTSRFGALADVTPGQAEQFALKLMRDNLPLLAGSAEVFAGETLVSVELGAAVVLLAPVARNLELQANAQARRESFG